MNLVSYCTLLSYLHEPRYISKHFLPAHPRNIDHVCWSCHMCWFEIENGYKWLVQEKDTIPDASLFPYGTAESLRAFLSMCCLYSNYLYLLHQVENTPKPIHVPSQRTILVQQHVSLYQTYHDLCVLNIVGSNCVVISDRSWDKWVDFEPLSHFILEMAANWKRCS